MAATGAHAERVGEWVRPRAWLVISSAVVGAAAGPVAVAGLTLYGGGSAFGTRKAFALGALALGFGVLGWSGSVLGGRGIEAMQRHLDTGSDWTEEDSRRAMARITGFGLGMMTSVGVLEAAL